MDDPGFDVWGIRGAAQGLWFVGAVWIVLAAVVHYWDQANYGMTVAAAVFFPVTYFAYPWTHVALVPLWTIFVAASSLYLIGSIRESGRVVVARETAGSVLHSRRPSAPRRRIVGSGLSGPAGRTLAARSQGLAPSGAGDSGGRDVEVGEPSPALVRSQAPARREVGSSAARRD